MTSDWKSVELWRQLKDNSKGRKEKILADFFPFSGTDHSIFSAMYRDNSHVSILFEASEK